MEMDKVEANTDNNKWDKACRVDTTLHLVSRLLKVGIAEEAGLESQ